MLIKSLIKGRDWQIRLVKRDPIVFYLQETQPIYKYANRLKEKGWRKIFHGKCNPQRIVVAILT